MNREGCGVGGGFAYVVRMVLFMGTGSVLRASQELNAGKDSLEDTLILHLEGGRDYFIDVSGEYARSCFGATLEELVAALDPIRGIAVPPDGQRRAALVPQAPTLSVPKVRGQALRSLARPK